jgi:anti-sigma B factor antagonist
MAQFALKVLAPTAAIISASGDIDPEAAWSFRRVLTEAAESGCPLILVDMGNVAFLDSAGLAVLVGFRRQLPLSQELALCNVPSRMRRVLNIAGTPRLMPVHAIGEPWEWPNVPQPEAPAS